GANGGLSIQDPVANSGLLLATNGSGVEIASVTTNTKTGIIEADGANSTVSVFQVIGGTLKTANGGIIYCGGMDGTGTHPITNKGHLVVNFAPTSMVGTIHNKGQIEIGALALITRSVVLDGKGEVSIDFASSLSTADNAVHKLTNV